MALLFRWLGVAGLEFRYAQQTLLIDPFITRPPLWRLWFGRVSPNRQLILENITHADYILITHAHWDHLLDAPTIASITGGILLGSPNTCRLAVVCGLAQKQIRQIKIGDELALGNFQVRVLAGEHVPLPGYLPSALSPTLKFPLRLRDYRMDSCFSFYLQTDQLRLLDWRGTDVSLAPQAEILFLGCERDASCYEDLLEVVHPRWVIPIHWDNFFQPLNKPLRPFYQAPSWAFPPLKRVNLEQFRHQIKKSSPETKVLLPEPLSIYDLENLSA